MKRYNYLAVCIAALCNIPLPGYAQPSEKSSVRLALTYNQLNYNLPILKASAKTKKGKKFEPVEGVEISFFFANETSRGFAGRIKTTSKGEASMVLPARFKHQFDSLSTCLFKATLTSNDQFEDASAEVEITKGKIELALIELDSTRTISAKVLIRNDTGWAAVPGVDVKLVVRRLLSDLSAGEELYTTGETGEASASYALTIPGDINGLVTFGAKIEDHDLLGNLTTTKTANWGIPLKPDNTFAKRTLFATRDKTPLWLLSFPNLLIAGVWGTIFYLLYQLIKIRKIGKTSSTT